MKRLPRRKVTLLQQEANNTPLPLRTYLHPKKLFSLVLFRSELISQKPYGVKLWLYLGTMGKTEEKNTPKRTPQVNLDQKLRTKMKKKKKKHQANPSIGQAGPMSETKTLPKPPAPSLTRLYCGLPHVQIPTLKPQLHKQLRRGKQ